jgi:general stress protein 26
MPDDSIEKIHAMLEDFDTAMLVTHSQDVARARPMAIACVESNCALWFFTGRDTAKVHEIEESRRVLIVCQNDHSSYLSLSGSAQLVSNRAKVRELWKETYRNWFPEGVDDPNLVLISVQPEAAEFWDNKGLNGIRYAFELVKAYATGTRPEVKEGEQHGKVALSPKAA